jgi:hypothetical protein
MHTNADDIKRIKLGSGLGKNLIIDHSTTRIIVGVLVRKDRANQGTFVSEALGLLERIFPREHPLAARSSFSENRAA